MAILWILINVMCAVNIRGREANFYEAEARCHAAEIEAEARKSEAEAEAEAEWFGLEATCASRPYRLVILCLRLRFVLTIFGAI